LLIVTLQAATAIAASSSDLLIVLDPDGQHYTAQQTLSTDQELLVLELPEQRHDLMVRFSGPEKQTFSTAHEHNPNTLSIWTGAAVSRYQHQYTEGYTLLEDGSIELNSTLAHPSVSTEDPATLSSTITWILPAGATLISLSEEQINPDIKGEWSDGKNSVSYTQDSGALANLTIQFALKTEEPELVIDPCVAVIEPNDACSPDIDQDEIPDYRDVCLPDENDLALSERPGEDALGCDGLLLVPLKNVNFQVGNSYLDVASRQVLDRVATALQRTPEHIFELAAHTDNGGTDENNQKLSESRAAAARHYLMLRGVGPNQVTAIGYGEQFPISSNETREGRRANRRIELKRLN